MRKPHWEVMVAEFPSFESGKRLLARDGNRKKLLKEMSQYGFLQKISSVEQVLAEKMPQGNVNRSGTHKLHEGQNALLTVFQMDGAKIFKMAREFSDELQKVSLNITADHLPTSNELICIEFADDMRFDMGGGMFARCVYVAATAEQAFDDEDQYKVVRYMQFAVPLYDKDENLVPTLQAIAFSFLSLDETFEEAIQRMMNRSGNTYKYTNRAFLQFVLNAFVYIHSGDPDLREYRPPRPPKTQKVKRLRLWEREHANQSMVDMTHVGFDFKKPRTYQMSETTVSGHFRWQVYGPRTDSKVKLIWIDSHVRNLKTEAEEITTLKASVATE